MTKKKLMLLESPHKAKVVSNFLSADYKVLATVGSMFDIENPTTEATKKKYDAFGVDTKNWERNLKCSNAKQFSLIKKELDSGVYDTLIVSTDPDRAGSQIGQDVVDALSAVIKRQHIKVIRASWSEVTKPAVEAGLKNAGAINQKEVDAADSRQIYDRLFGFAISGNVQKTIREKSAGRVQSPALRLIVNREKERLAFTAAEYLSLTGTFAVGAKAVNLDAKLLSIGERKIAIGSSFDSTGKVQKNEYIITPANVAKLEEFLNKCKYEVSDVAVKPYSRKPPMPYTTSSFQQDVGTRLRLSSKQIMSVAQQLFDQGYISYMRTDSPHLGDEALKAAFAEAKRLYPGSTPANPTVYKAKGQGGHEAIRPVCDNSGKFRAPKSIQATLSKIDKNAYAVYEAIYNRTVASQMKSAVGFTTTVKISSTNTPVEKKATFAAAATTYTDLGWMKLTKPTDEDEGSANVISDKIAKGEDALLKKLTTNSHKTTPPARFTEPQLVAKLEELEIGRPSTYASIVTVNQTRGYVRKKAGKLYPTWGGMKVAQYLEGKIPSFVSYEATALMEEELDKIEQGTLQKNSFLKNEWARIKADVLSLNDNVDWEEINKLSTIELNNGFVVRVNAYGAFLEDTSLPLDANGRRAGVKLSDEENVAELDFSDVEVCRKLTEASQNRVEARELGVLSSGTYQGWTVTARDGKYGAFLQALPPETVEALAKGEKAPASAPAAINHPLPEGAELATVKLDDVEELFAEVKLPRTLSDNFFTGIGKRGPWLGRKASAKARKATFVSLPEEYNPRTMTLADAQKVWEEKEMAKASSSAKKTTAKKTTAKKTSPKK